MSNAPRQDTDSRVRERCVVSDGLMRWRRKVYQLRRLVAGDFSRVLPTTTTGATRSDAPGSDLKLDDLYDFLVTSWDDAHSNRLLESIRQMLMTATYSRPHVEFEGLSSKLASVNAGWIKHVLSEEPIGCAAVDSMRLGFLDFIIGGFGFSYVGMRHGGPVLDTCDSLDMNWSRDVKHPAHIRFASCRYRENMEYWIGLFGWKAMSQVWDASGKSLDDHLELEFYFDTDIGDGQFYVLHPCEPGARAATIIHQGPNPLRYTLGERQVPANPYSPLYFTKLPSTTEPIGLVEMMFPDQLRIWGIEEYKATAIERNKPFWKASEGALNTEERKKFLDGEYGALVEVRKGDITPSGTLPLDPAVMHDLAYHERRLTAMAGTNPYASGSPVDGIEYSSEVREISNMSGIVVGYVSEENAMWWMRSTRKLLLMGSLYDDRAIDIPTGPNEVISFNAYRPVKPFLRPLADLVISADKMAFRPRAQRVQEAMRDLDIAGRVANLFPNAVGRAYEKYLRATGELDIAGYLEMPTSDLPGGINAQAVEQAVTATG